MIRRRLSKNHHARRVYVYDRIAEREFYHIHGNLQRIKFHGSGSCDYGPAGQQDRDLSFDEVLRSGSGGRDGVSVADQQRRLAVQMCRNKQKDSGQGKILTMYFRIILEHRKEKHHEKNGCS